MTDDASARDPHRFSDDPALRASRTPVDIVSPPARALVTGLDNSETRGSEIEKPSPHLAMPGISHR